MTDRFQRAVLPHANTRTRSASLEARLSELGVCYGPLNDIG